MADVNVVEKPKRQHTWIWALLAAAAVVGLMLWLASQSAELNEVAEVAEERAAAEEVALAAIVAAPDTFAERTVTVAGVDIAAPVGARAFWGGTGEQTMLVVLAPDATDPALIQPGSTVTVDGVVSRVTVADVSAWVESGTITEESREEIANAEYFLEASEIRQ